MDSVYLETTVIGHLTGRIHPDPIVAARQATTREWWRTAPVKYQLFVSELVVDECSFGDVAAAQERLEFLKPISLLKGSPKANTLAQELLDRHAVPVSQPRDALHIAIAATAGVQYLLTWNFKHIANPATLYLIESVCRDEGYAPPRICIPDALLEIDNGP